MRATVADVDCYTGIGLEYRGSASRAVGGAECLDWAKTRLGMSLASGGSVSETIGEQEVAGILTPGHRACRNYGGGKINERPWCLVPSRQAQEQVADCDVPQCPPAPASLPAPTTAAAPAPLPPQPHPQSPPQAVKDASGTTSYMYLH